jgi:hypothetical protein
MIEELNLRRNLITEVGVEAVVSLLLNHDTKITHVNLQRNLIGKNGA